MLRCDNCQQLFDHTKHLAHLFPNIPDMLQRLDPGGTVPAGDCPACGALVYPDTPKHGVVLLMNGGVVHEVITDDERIDVMILDQDIEGAEEDEIVQIQRGADTLEAVACFPQHTFDPEWTDQMAGRFSQ
jgi:hypothetical protein